jgi:hypothetical protein
MIISVHYSHARRLTSDFIAHPGDGRDTAVSHCASAEVRVKAAEDDPSVVFGPVLM